MERSSVSATVFNERWNGLSSLEGSEFGMVCSGASALEELTLLSERLSTEVCNDNGGSLPSKDPLPLLLSPSLEASKANGGSWMNLGTCLTGSDACFD